MLTEDTLNALHNHYAETLIKNEPFNQGPPVVRALRARIDKLEAAIGSTADPNHLSEIARRLLQTAAIALRAVQDLGLTPNPPKSKPE